MKKIKNTNNGKDGGTLVGKAHYDKDGKSLGGIKTIITDDNRPVEVEGGEVIINKHASKKHWRELSRINQSAGNGVPITEPHFKKGGNTEKSKFKSKVEERKQKVAKVMHEFKEGKLKSHGKKITKHKQAVAIALSKALKLKDGSTIPKFKISYYDNYLLWLETLNKNKHFPILFTKSESIKDFGDSFYINIFDKNWRQWVKIRFSGHAVTNIGRVFNEIHNPNIDTFYSIISRALSSDEKKENPENSVSFKTGGELAKGIKSEQEHIGTAPKSIAKEHLKEDSKYYTKLSKAKLRDGGYIEPHKEVKTDLATVLNELNYGEYEETVYLRLRNLSDEKMLDEIASISDDYQELEDAIQLKIDDYESRQSDIDSEIDEVNDGDLSKSKKATKEKELQKEYKEINSKIDLLKIRKEEKETLKDQFYVLDVDDDYVKEIIQKVGARLQTRENINAGTDLFPEDANIKEFVKKAPTTNVSKIKKDLKLYDEDEDLELLFIMKKTDPKNFTPEMWELCKKIMSKK